MFDGRLIQDAIAAELLGFLGYSLSYTGSLYILSVILSSLGIVSGPALQAALVNHASSERSGEALSASEMLYAAARLFTPTAMKKHLRRNCGRISTSYIPTRHCDSCRGIIHLVAFDPKS
jgi:hypothetical protein